MSLDGASGHGSQDYLNLIQPANSFVIAHESGHVLEQRTSAADPTILDQWKAVIAADKVSVSTYGDTSHPEEKPCRPRGIIMQSGYFVADVQSVWTISITRPLPSMPKPAPDIENSCLHIPSSNHANPAPRNRILSRTRTAAIRKIQIMCEYLGRCTFEGGSRSTRMGFMA